MKKKSLLFCFYFYICASFAQVPNPALIGYWHNWNDANAPYLQLDQIDSRYTVIEVAFAIPTSPSDMNMLFVPDQISQATFISKVQGLQSQGKKVFISIGGATTSIDLTTIQNKNAFVNSMSAILATYGFDGIDIDIENGNSILASGTIAQPTSAASINLIDAIKQIMLNYRTANSKKLLLSLAPETAYVLGGQSAYGGIWGGYLPVLEGLRDSIDLVQVQLYNSGSMYGIDGAIYTQGTADFIVAMTEAVIQGFNTAGGAFAGFAANKIAVALPACSSAAGGGFVDTATVKAALDYLRGNGPQPGAYVLAQSSGYPSLGGLMTWSINWDATNICASNYSFARNFDRIFITPNSLETVVKNENDFVLYPNPAKTEINIRSSAKNKKVLAIKIYSSQGELLQTSTQVAIQMLSIANLKPGIYFVLIENKVQKLVIF